MLGVRAARFAYFENRKNRSFRVNPIPLKLRF